MLTINSPITSIQEVTISEHDVARINSIETLYKGERQKSKSPTFALTRRSLTA
jgi:hypothetical protein